MDPTEYWDQLYFSQTQHLWVSTYTRAGLFSREGMTRFELARGEMQAFGEREGMDAVARVIKVLQEMKDAVTREGKKGCGVSFVYQPGMEGLQAWRTKNGARRRLAAETVETIFG